MKIESVYPAGFIPVPYIFIDQYMCAANGEFVKTYLLLLRSAGESDLSVSLLADRLEQTEKDVRRGLKYWEKEGLLAVEENDGKIERLLLCYPGEPLPERFRKEKEAKAEEEKKEEETPKPEAAGKEELVAEAPELRSYSAAQLKKLRGQEDFGQLLFVAEHYLGRTLSPRDTDVFAYLYDGLKLPGEVLEFLIEYCVDIWEKKERKKDHTIIRYMEQVALNWHKNGVHSLEAARKQIRLFEQENTSWREIEKALGLKNRQLTDAEQSFFTYWLYEKAMPKELILEGCRKTIRNKGEFRQEYLQGILEGWEKQGVRTLADAAEADRRHAEQEAGAKKTNKAKTKADAAPRRVDYDAAMRDLFVQSIKYGTDPGED